MMAFKIKEVVVNMVKIGKYGEKLIDLSRETNLQFL